MLRFLALVMLMMLMSSPAISAERVMVGAYVNDIQQIDLHSDSYRMDLYVWFRWRDPAIDPSKSYEFMNAFNPADHVKTPAYDAPQKMPDGTLYMVVREQGEFSAKFPLQQYPFDRQELLLSMEDTVHATNELVYVPDDKAISPVTLNKRIRLSGFTTGEPRLDVENFEYPTNFGDVSQPEAAVYSRAIFAVPISRPPLATGIKVFMPVLLVLLCTAVVFFVHPAYIEGRLGVAITALLTLVALQLTSNSALPDVDYLLMTDKVYLLSYAFIIATMLQVARVSRLVHEHQYEGVRISDRRAVWLFAAMLGVGCILIYATTF
ncbi:MAG TPA: hypothetical protein VEF76_04510 [Patescibacteria group bacterium]|nr:hypothetical protein [Patescibacteria group bacterium]